MSDRGTTSLGSYIQFQSAVLRQLPRPEDFDRAGVNIDDWINNQLSMKTVLLRGFLPPLPIAHETVREFPVWKTLKLRVNSGPSFYHHAIENKRVGIHRMCVGDSLNSSEFGGLSEEMEVDLGRATIKELTGKNKARFEDYFMAIRRVGQLCPKQVGPELRLAYEDQPVGECLFIGMQPLANGQRHLYSFRVSRSKNELQLSRFEHQPDYEYSGELIIVFVLPRKK